MKIDIIETETATILIIPKGQPSAVALADLVPSKVVKASQMWKEGKQAREICKALRVPMPKYSSATEYIIRLRMLYSTSLFPYRAEQLPELAKNGAAK